MQEFNSISQNRKNIFFIVLRHQKKTTVYLFVIALASAIYSGFLFVGTEWVQIGRRLVVFVLLYFKQFCHGNAKHRGEILPFIIQHGTVSRFNTADGLLRQVHFGKP